MKNILRLLFKIKEVFSINVSDGDILVFEIDNDVTRMGAEFLTDYLRNRFPDNEILLLQGVRLVGTIKKGK